MKSLRYSISLFLFALLPFALSAQCEFAQDTIDPFDSTRLVMSKPISIGLLIPSLYETVEGPKIIDEAKAAFSFVEDDQSDINAFFLTIVAAEYDYLSIESGKNVIIAFEDSTAVSLLNFPDRGQFSQATNMRMYQHTCVVPIDLYYRMAYSGIKGIRIRYADKKRTILLSKEQQEQIKEAVRCAGEAIGLAPNKP
jgi:hypothetical protein